MAVAVLVEHLLLTQYQELQTLVAVVVAVDQDQVH
jgi:hypothetical protein